MRKIYTYQNVQNFIESSDEKLKNKFQNILAYISNKKNELREPYVRHISHSKLKELYEIRLKASGIMARVIFSKQDENIILLYAFYKNDSKDTKKALEHSLSKVVLSQKVIERTDIVTRALKEIRSEYFKIHFTRDGVLESKYITL